jgi:Asp-tRNA(Asn)/Glu-tRNA(Gln) amidotransferase A subunit family amidase
MAYRPLTFFDAVPRFGAGEDDPRQYLERCLEVIATREPVVKAWVVLNERGAREAADASAARWRSGKPLSRIDGMPIGIKDLIETKDMPTQMGCAALEGNFPKRDSALVRALREAGAIIVGKLVTTELGGAHPGPTTNPFDPRRTPGGSSSGSGAAVGAGMLPGYRYASRRFRHPPASYCANWALKPTYGALNRGERLGYSQSAIGVHAGSPIDMWHVRNGDRATCRRRSRASRPLRHAGGSRTRQATALVVMETNGWKELAASTLEAFERVLASLRAAGRHDRSPRRLEARRIVRARHRSLKAINSDICAFELRWSSRKPRGAASRQTQRACAEEARAGAAR